MKASFLFSTLWLCLALSGLAHARLITDYTGAESQTQTQRPSVPWVSVHEASAGLGLPFTDSGGASAGLSLQLGKRWKYFGIYLEHSFTGELNETFVVAKGILPLKPVIHSVLGIPSITNLFEHIVLTFELGGGVMWDDDPLASKLAPGLEMQRGHWLFGLSFQVYKMWFGYIYESDDTIYGPLFKVGYLW